MANDGREVLQEMFRHNRWANLRVLDACEAAGDAVMDTPLASGLGSPRDTLWHIAANEEGYLGVLTGDPTPDSLFGFQAAPALEVLRHRLDRSGTALAEIAATVDASDTVYPVRQGETWEIRTMAPLLQAVNHGTEHREQIKAALTLAGLEPPKVDFWTYASAMGYARPVAD